MERIVCLKNDTDIINNHMESERDMTYLSHIFPQGVVDMDIQLLCKKFEGDNCHKSGKGKDFLQKFERMKPKALINSVS